MIMLWISATASAFEVDGIAYSIESDNEVAVTSKTEKYTGSIIIPREVTYMDIIYTVTSIEQMAFFDCSDISAVTIPATVYKIGTSAFSGCKNLTDISLPNMIEVIPERCFTGCSNLQSVTLPHQLKSIAENAFNNCTALQTIEFPNSLQEIGDYAFSGCTALDNVFIPSSITQIPTGCFNGCRNLKDIELGNGIARIAPFAFYTYSDIYLHLPPSIEYIDKSIIYSGGLVLYRGNIKLDKQNSGVNIVILDSAFPTIIERGDAHLFLANPQSFLSSNSYLSSNVSSIGEYGKKGSEYIFWYDGTPQPLNKGWLNNDSRLLNMGIEWYCADFDVKDAGYYSGNAIIEARHNDWSNSFQVSYAFEVLKVELTIRVNDCEKIYGDENPQFSFEANGFKANDNAETAINNIIFRTPATINSEVGDYSIALTAESNNYKIISTEGILKVTPAPLIVHINDASRVYGDENPIYHYNFIGLKCNDISPEFTVPLQFTNIDKSANCGEYGISIVAGELRNYFINKVYPGTLTITKRDLTAKVNNCERLYGEENPEFEISYIGFVYDDNESSFIKRPTAECNATKSSNVGTYPIVATGGEATNYNILTEDGILKINPLSVGFKDIYHSITYNDMTLSTNDNYFNYIPEITGPFSEDDFWIDLWFLDKDNTNTQHVATISGGDYAGNYVNTNVDRPMWAGKYIFNLIPKGTNPNVVANPARAYLTVNKASNNLEWNTNSPIYVKIGEKVDLGISYQADLWCTFNTDYDDNIIELSSKDANGNNPHWFATGRKEGSTTLYFRVVCKKNDMGFYDFTDSKTVSKRIIVEATTGIEEIATSPDSKFDVYSINGIMIKKGCTVDDLHRLPKGIYIVVSESKRYKIAI